MSEAEYYALCHGGAHGLALQAYLRDLGLNSSVTVQSDSSSAKAFASRRGLGKQRHVQTRFLWIQERVACGHLAIRKIPGSTNVADILTKDVAAPLLEKHGKALGLRVGANSRLQKTTV